MSEHLDLFGLLRGELGNAEAVAAGAHLAGCPTCQEELVDAVVGHALLARAARTLGPETETSRPAPLGVLPPSRRRRGALLAGAAAVVLALGATAAVWWHSDGDQPGRGVEAALAPLSEAEPGDGSVRMVEDDGRTRMTVAVHDLPDATSGEFYYAWLLDPDTNITLGTRYLAAMAQHYDGSPWLASAAYNAGVDPVGRWIDARDTLEPDFFIETIPYKETREYVARVLAFSLIYDWRLNGTVIPLSSKLPRIGKAYSPPADDAPRKAVACATQPQAPTQPAAAVSRTEPPASSQP